MVLQKKLDQDKSGSGEAFAVTDRLKAVPTFAFQTDWRRGDGGWQFARWVAEGMLREEGVVEMKGFEPSACALRTHRSPI